MLAFLMRLRLSLVQITILALSALVTGLVVAFRLQGSELHAAQIALLSEHLRNTDERNRDAVQASRERFVKALKAYKEAK